MIPKIAMLAIQDGIKNENTIAQLEYLGVSLRTINQIEEHCGLIYLKDLVSLTDEKILAIPNLGEKGLASIKIALQNYHKLGATQKRWHSGSPRLDYYKKNSKRLEGILS